MYVTHEVKSQRNRYRLGHDPKKGRKVGQIRTFPITKVRLFVCILVYLTPNFPLTKYLLQLV